LVDEQIEMRLKEPAGAELQDRERHGSDLDEGFDDAARRLEPVLECVIGHELSGEVESVGEGGRSGIGEIGLPALENVQVGAAHAGAPQADQRGSRRDFRLGPLDERQLVRAGAEQGSHRSPVA
jgi:hypothetical protein